jgi:hypothetical protein
MARGSSHPGPQKSPRHVSSAAGLRGEAQHFTGPAARPVQHANPVPNPQCRGPTTTPQSDHPLACSVPATGVGSVGGPAVYWFLDTSVYSLIEYLAAKHQSLLVNGKRHLTSLSSECAGRSPSADSRGPPGQALLCKREHECAVDSIPINEDIGRAGVPECGSSYGNTG